MERAFLYLYPVSFYTRLEWPKINYQYIGKCLDYFIQKRYRDNGYQAYWLCFSMPNDQDEPDLLSVDNAIVFRDCDKIITSGLSHTSPEWLSNQYPDSETILDKLGHIQELVLAGHHQWDCVDRIAQCAHERLIITRIDEDLTESFGKRLLEGIPLNPAVSWQQLEARLRVDMISSELPSKVLLERRIRPWLNQWSTN